MNARSIALLAATLILCIAAPGHAQRVFFRSVSIHDHTGVEFTVNGFPFRSPAATEQPLITTDLTGYLVQGVNTVTWKFTGQPTVDAPTMFRFRLEKKTEGVDQVAEMFTIERTLEFQQEDTAPDVVTFFAERLLVKPSGVDFQHELRTRLTPGKATKAVIDLSAPESRLSPLPAEPAEIQLSVTIADLLLATLPWQGAPVALTPADEAEIKGIITAMHDAFAAHDTTALADLQTVRIQRFATARAETQGAFRQELIDSYADLFGNPPFVFDAVNPAALTLTSYAGVNLVQVELNGQPPIRATGQLNGGAGVFQVPVYVSKIGGVWKIVD